MQSIRCRTHHGGCQRHSDVSVKSSIRSNYADKSYVHPSCLAPWSCCRCSAVSVTDREDDMVKNMEVTLGDILASALRYPIERKLVEISLNQARVWIIASQAARRQGNEQRSDLLFHRAICVQIAYVYGPVYAAEVYQKITGRSSW